jgi:hypothetical protein
MFVDRAFQLFSFKILDRDTLPFVLVFVGIERLKTQHGQWHSTRTGGLKYCTHSPWPTALDSTSKFSHP